MSSPGPQSVESRPSAWGGLTALLDTPAKQITAIVVMLAAMIVAPWVLGPYATVRGRPSRARTASLSSARRLSSSCMFGAQGACS